MKLYFILFSLLLPTCLSVQRFTPDWDSLDSRPLPGWYDEAKVGIFMHFGVYSVQAFRDAWFWFNWKNKVPDYVNFMQQNYPPKFTYQDFGPQLSMEFFNASLFADIIAGSGAKYLVFTSKHHEGFTNWPSSYSFGWNSMDIGPKKNVLGELKAALDERQPGVKFGVYYSLFEWFHPLYLHDKSNNFTTREFALNKMLPEMKELIETFKPHVLWSDGDWEAHPEYFGSQDFLAWLYNDSPVKDTIVTNDRWGIGTGKTHGGFWSGPDRWSPGVLIGHKWENAMTVDKESWGNRKNILIEDILEMKELLTLLASTVSCGGNILINVGPSKEGTIIPIFQERLKSLGTWLKVNGEAIYSTTPWTHQNDALAQETPVWYTAGKGDLEGTIYALVIGWPKGDVLTLGSVQASESSTTTIQLIGFEGDLDYDQTESRLQIGFPNMSQVIEQCGLGCQWVYALKIQKAIPAFQRDYQIEAIK